MIVKYILLLLLFPFIVFGFGSVNPVVVEDCEDYGIEDSLLGEYFFVDDTYYKNDIDPDWDIIEDNGNYYITEQSFYRFSKMGGSMFGTYYNLGDYEYNVCVVEGSTSSPEENGHSGFGLSDSIFLSFIEFIRLLVYPFVLFLLVVVLIRLLL
jgi:hypothetical protein